MKKLNRIGVVVGRFQVATLHAGHKYLLRRAKKFNTHLFVVLGTPEFPTPRNPLSFEMRKRMLEKAFPGTIVAAIADRRSDQEWIETLDALISERFPNADVTLYGSRDSFLAIYRGKYRSEIVDELPGYSGTQERARVARSKRSSAAYREGIVHGFVSRLAVTRPMVDIAVLKRVEGLVLLGGKPTDPPDRWRFPGGLVDPTDASLESAAKREAREELSDIEIDDVTYIGSTPIDDRRYRNSGEFAITSMCVATYIFGAPRAGDDLSRVEWFPIKNLKGLLVPEHAKLGEMLTTHLSRA